MPGKNKKQLKAAPKRRKAKRAKSKTFGAASKGTKAKTAVAAVLDSQKLQSLYATMLKTRMLNQRAEEILSAKQRDNIIAGREAALTGAIAHALSGDSIAATQNGLLASFIRGTPLKSVFEQIIPADQQSSDSMAGQNGMDFSSESTLARGMALANEIKGTSNVVLVFSGEFSADRDAHYEGLTLAAQSKLPLVCLAETTSIEEQRANHPSTTGASHFPRIAVDGNDVVAVFRVAQEAVRRARAGHGPSLIECVMPEHAQERRPASKVTEEALDPLTFMQQYLHRRKLWADEWKQKIADEFRQELDAAIANTENLPAGENRSDRAFTPNASSSRPPRSLPQPDKATPSRA